MPCNNAGKPVWTVNGMTPIEYATGKHEPNGFGKRDGLSGWQRPGRHDGDAAPGSSGRNIGGYFAAQDDRGGADVHSLPQGMPLGLVNRVVTADITYQTVGSIFTNKRGMVIASSAPFFAEEIEDDLHLALEGIAIHRGVWGTLASRELSSMPVSNPLTR
ncbi:hypothetical protein BH24CHL1_BH24CHL1_17050 [soil metagenome]